MISHADINYYLNMMVKYTNFRLDIMNIYIHDNLIIEGDLMSVCNKNQIE